MAQDKIKIQKQILALTVALFVIKIAAWWLTHSVAVLTDALEYTINVMSAGITLYSLNLAALPKDSNHPYGHGKAEFLSAAVEGTLMVVSAFLIIYEAINNLLHPHLLGSLSWGMWLLFATALLNLAGGQYAVRCGRKMNSMAIEATGKHLLSDTWGTLGILLGLLILNFTGLVWIDSLVALIFSGFIFFSGYKILRSSVAGMMDEADDSLLKEVVVVLENQKPNQWIDLHNLRIIKYGSTLHLDAHLTIPWYFNIHEAHKEIDRLSDLVRAQFGERIELFVHTDGCLEFSCCICPLADCPVRQHPFEKRIEWTVGNISQDAKHTVDS